MPLLIIPPLLAAAIAGRERNYPAAALMAGVTLLAVLLSDIMITVFRQPFL